VTHGGPLVGANGWPHLEHLPAEARDEALLASTLGDLFEIFERSLLVTGLAVVERDREPLGLDRPVDARRERVDALALHLGLGLELEAVHPDVAHAVDPDEPFRIRSGPAADTGDECVTPGETRDFGARLLGDPCLTGAAHDRRERAVDVEEDRRAFWSLRQGRQGIETHSS